MKKVRDKMINFRKDEGCKCLLCMGKRGGKTAKPIRINRHISNEENVVSFNICSVCFEEMKKEINELNYDESQVGIIADDNDAIITEDNLTTYSKIDKIALVRAKEIAEHLGLVHSNYSTEIEIGKSYVYINVLDRYDDYTDGIIMTHKEFSSSNYIKFADEIYLAKRKEKEEAKRLAEEKDRLLKEEKEKREYERLKAKFDNK